MKPALLFVGLAPLLLACTAESGCDETSAAPGVASGDTPAEAEPERAPTPKPESKLPDAAACTSFIEHMAVVSAQSFGAAATAVYTEAEKAAAVEHCQRFAHSRVLQCAEDTQVWSYFTTCLHARSLARPRLQTPTREDCERFRDRTIAINNAVQTKIGGYPTPGSARSRARAVDSCLAGMTTAQVECGVAAQTQLDILSCFSPYDVGEDRSWPTAEECEDYADKLPLVRLGYMAMPFPKPLEVNEALAKSGMQGYMLPSVHRSQYVNLCHTLDRDMVQCHMSANEVVDLAACVP